MARLKYKLEEYTKKEIQTKLGKVIIDESSSICFPKGIVGFPSLHYYSIVDVPENQLPGAYMLQSIEDDKLAFVILPLVEKFYTGENSLIMNEDIKIATDSYGILAENLKLFVIAKIQKIEENIKFSINLKAPILLDAKEKVAYQHVFIRKDYPLAYYLV